MMKNGRGETDSSGGLWSQIKRAAPTPEVEEIAHIIGRKLIDTNENLWRELAALKEIVADFLTFEVKNMDLLDSGSRNEKSRKKHDYSHSRNNFDGENRDSDSECAGNDKGSDDIMAQVKGSLTVDRVGDVISVVREAFAHERTELEAEISLLQTTMDTESEIISRGNTPRGDDSRNSFDHFTKSPLSTCGESRRQADSASSQKSAVIIGPGRIRRADSLSKKHFNAGITVKNPPSDHLMESVSEKLIGLQNTTMISTTTVDDHSFVSSVDPSVSRNVSSSRDSRSRIRSRIETARDERFFMDEDFYMT